MAAKPNAFGDVRGEHDHRALDESFYEWQDYRALFESSDRFIVVGRRGTGKSAITYRLSKIWGNRKTPVITVAPLEEQMMGLRPLAEIFGQSLPRIRAGIKIAWKHAILMEICADLLRDYKSKGLVEKNAEITEKVRRWERIGTSPVERMRSTLKQFRSEFDQMDERVAELSGFLSVERLLTDVSEILRESQRSYVLLVDRLDEGYEPDIVGTSIIDGILYGTDDLRMSLPLNFRAIVFIRDNMLRAIESEDRDFTRNLESQVLRLHWDHQELFYLVANRIRYAFGIAKESDVKVWNAITANELHGRAGFRRCLRFTLYRPRDVIALLNTAFYQAQRQNRQVLIEEDFDESAKEISMTRFNDLGKEYEAVFPGVSSLTSVFSNGEAKLRLPVVLEKIDAVMNSPQLSLSETQHFKILATAEETLKALYGIGFLGVYDKQLASFVYSHDGKRLQRVLTSDDILLVHPCYWPALNIAGYELTQGEAEEIYDEYEISIESQSGEQRKKILGQLMNELNSIPEGANGAAAFEAWCKRAMEISFSKSLTSFELNAGTSARAPKYIVASNQGSGIWEKLKSRYESNKILFQIINHSQIGTEDYSVACQALGGEFGSIAFLVCRDAEYGLRKGVELETFRKHQEQGLTLVKFPAQQLVTILSKLRNPEKIDAGALAVDRLVDTHERIYTLKGTGAKPKSTARRDRR